MTPQKCIQYCSTATTAPYNYAGLEYGRECCESALFPSFPHSLPINTQNARSIDTYTHTYTSQTAPPPIPQIASSPRN
jgi:hypothetical protein